MRRLSACIALALLAPLVHAADKPLPEGWEYGPAMRAVAAKGTGRPGVILHIGDSITYANPYGAWARSGAGQTAEDKAALAWSHAGKNDDSDGWFLARFDHPDGGRSHTAAGGCRLDEMLAGGKAKLPSLAAILDTYKPQAVVFMLGTNDASAGRKAEVFRADLDKAVGLMLERGIVPILSTIPPHVGKPDLAKAYNEAIRDLARERKVPLIDFEKEVLARRPDDWDGTLLGKGDVHPSANRGTVTPASEPTSENLRNSGYLLRGWLSVRKIAEVKAKVFDTTPDKPTAGQPKGTPVRVPVTRDTWLSNVGEEADGSNGGATKLKLKGHQELSVVDIDPAPLKGHTILAATLHLKLAGPERLHRVTVGTVASEWHEGTATNYEKQKGASTHNHRRHPDEPWAGSGSDLCSVILGNTPASTWRMADAWPPDAEGWQKIPVDPLIVQARVAGVSHGFLVFDDTGSEWTRDGEKWSLRLFPNRFVHSRESGPKNAPYFTIWLGDKDETSPARPEGLAFTDGRLTWKTPEGAVGFVVTADGKEVPRPFVPLTGEAGLTGLPQGTKAVAVRAVDGAGNVWPPAELAVAVPAPRPAALPGTPAVLDIPKEVGPLPTLGGLEVAILDELDKVSPTTGALTPEQPAGYASKNHLWDAKNRRITLHAARNEVVAFQVHLRGPAKGVTVEVDYGKIDAVTPRAAFGKYECVGSKKGPMPDPIMPLKAGEKYDVPEGHKSGSLHIEFRVPKDVTGDRREGKLVLKSGADTLELELVFLFWDFELPDRLSFLPEMNCYGLPDDFLPWYRLAHDHRTVLNCVPYSQAGQVSPGWAPKWDGKDLDWKAWDARFGPLFDGSAFDGPYRKGVPQECFYLPLHENWPAPMEGNYNGDYWADRAFPSAYRRDLVRASELFARHLDAKGWDGTLFQFFLNGKNNFKERGWSRGSSPWLLDEPANFQDYWALRWYGAAFHEGVRAASPRQARLLFRADISRPMWQRDSLDGLLDYNVVSGSFRQYRRMVLDRSALNIEYGGSNAVEDSNVQPLGWCIDAWSLGTDGVVPWLAVGNADSWRQGTDTGLLYPPRKGDAGPVPSVRLKAYRRGQQDAEYLARAAAVTNQPRAAVGALARSLLKLAGKREGSGFVGGEDAGVLTYRQLKPQDAWTLRTRLGEGLSGKRAADPPRFTVPPRDPSKLAERMVTVGELAPVAARPTEKPAAATSEAKVLRGRSVTRDTLISFEQPEKTFGTSGRDNALRRAERTNAYLVRFDLATLKGTPGDQVESATLSFFVWDPSSKGNTKVVAAPLKTAWTETEATWKRPAAGKMWAGEGFDPAKDCEPAGPAVVVKPDAGGDTADPPVEYGLDVTEAVRSWLGGSMANAGVAILPVIDRAVDDGQHTRFQIHSSRHGDGKFGPTLTVRLKR